MLDQKAAAQLVIQPVVSTCHEIVGMVSSEMSNGSSLSKAAISRLQVRIVPVASRAARDFAELLDNQLQSVIKSESHRAERELSVAQSESMLERSPSVSAMQERVEAELRAYGVEGVRILNAMSSQAMVNASAGHRAQAAMSLARTSVNGRFSRWASGKVGNGHSIVHRLYLCTAELLMMAGVSAYLAKASSLGVIRFRIDNPGKRGDGESFSPSSVPYRYLHPQSGAKVIAVR